MKYIDKSIIEFRLSEEYGHEERGKKHVHDIMSRGEHKRNLCGTNQAQGPRLSHSLPINSSPLKGEMHTAEMIHVAARPY